jgi:hypothetical protein
MFFGRRDVLTSIQEHLIKGRRVFAISGARRMGKTSLLRQLPGHLPDGFIPVKVELLDENAQRFDWLLWRLAVAAADQVGRRLEIEIPEPAWGDYEAHSECLREHLWPQILAALGEAHLVLMLDDFDSLGQGDGALLDLLAAFLSDWREKEPRLALILTMGVAQQEALARACPRLFGGAPTYALGPLSGEEASRLMTWPVEGVLTYDYGVTRRLNEISSGRPYFLQLLCFEVFNRCARAGWVNLRDVDLIVEDLIGREISDFRHVWVDSSPQEQAALAAIVSLRGARGVATAREVQTALNRAGSQASRDLVAQTLEHLATREILERLGATSYRFRVALLRDWLAERLDLQEIAHHTRWNALDWNGGEGGQGVSRLRARKVERREPPPETLQPEEPGDAQEDEAPATWTSRIWLVALAVLCLVVLMAGGLWLVRPLLLVPEASATTVPSATASLAIATRTPAPLVTTQQAATVAPTSTATPVPTVTPTPTPPQVVARSVPSIVYQARAAGEEAWSIFAMSSDGGHRVFLTEGQSEFLSALAWSPDGSRIAFVSERGGNPDVWVMGSDGSNATNVTNDEAKDHSPAWSPNGEWIAFASVRDSRYWELYLMRPDGADVQRLTWWEDASDLFPTWSPDSTRLAFASKRDGNWEIYAVDIDGSNLLRLTDHPADDTNPAWSPDGSRIAFESTRDGYTDIFVMPVAGGEPVNLTNLSWATDLGPTWSPDGGRIAFYSDRDGNWDIHVMASDGSNAVKLTGETTNDQVPAWRP